MGRRRGPERRSTRARILGRQLHYTKLQRIKAKYDPSNMFCLNHNVKPSAAPAAASPTKPKPRRSLSGRVLSALSPGKKK